MMFPSLLLAQSSGSINTYSPYSMYGLGELNTQGSLTSRAMGGIGVSLRSPTEINTLNPASYSSALNRSVLFSYGMEGSNYFNKQYQNGSSVNNSYASFNFHDISLQVPLAKNLGLGFSLSPYSSTGYYISTQESVTDIGMLSYTYEGSGDITQIQVGVGWRPFENLSFGIAAHYYWGALDRSFTMSPYVVTGNGVYYSTTGKTTYNVSKIKAQLGMQWVALKDTKRNWAFGATYDLGGNLSPECTHQVVGSGSLLAFYAVDESDRLALVLPNKLAIGTVYQTPKWLLGVDYVYENWATGNGDTVEYTSSGVAVGYNNFSTFKLGAQWTPNRNDVRNYFKRVSYRGGLRYGGYQQTFGGQEIEQFAVTMGASFPVKMSGLSKIEMGLEYGSRGSANTYVNNVGLVRQDYFKFSLGFSLFGEDYWFQRPKFD